MKSRTYLNRVKINHSCLKNFLIFTTLLMRDIMMIP